MGLVVGITGVSRAGKTTLSNDISNAFYGKSNILSMDAWPNPIRTIPRISGVVDWESPKSINFRKLYQEALRSRAQFDLTIVEGILIQSYQPLTRLLDKSIVVEIPKDVFLRRKRDDKRWDMDPWYFDHIWRSYHKFPPPRRSRRIDGARKAQTGELLRWILSPGSKPVPNRK